MSNIENPEPEIDLVTENWLRRYLDPKTGEITVPPNFDAENSAGQIAAFQYLEKIRAAEADFLAHHHVRYVG